MSESGQPADPRRSSAVVLLVINLLPLAGVLLFDWDLAALVVLYWSENLVIGAYNVLKMFTARGAAAVFPALFFSVHYGGFCAVHGFFIASLLLDQTLAPPAQSQWPVFLIFAELLIQVLQQVLAQAPAAWTIACAGLLISHGYSFYYNFLRGGEREVATINTLMAAPYKRIVVLHVAIIIGGFGVMELGQPLVLLIAMVVLKTVIDLRFHRREHQRASQLGLAQRHDPRTN